MNKVIFHILCRRLYYVPSEQIPALRDVLCFTYIRLVDELSSDRENCYTTFFGGMITLVVLPVCIRDKINYTHVFCRSQNVSSTTWAYFHDIRVGGIHAQV